MEQNPGRETLNCHAGTREAPWPCDGTGNRSNLAASDRVIASEARS